MVVLGSGLVATTVNADVSLDLVGEIETRCELMDVGPDNLRFDANTRVVLDFELYCNVEMGIALSSENGGLLNEAAAVRRRGDTGLLRRYTATLAVDSIGFSRSVVSSELVGGATFDAGSDIAFASSGRVGIELDEPLGEGYAGEYVDELRLSVFPSLGAIN